MSFERGNAATPEGLTVYDGVDPDDFVCRDCPLQGLDPLDETSQLTLGVWNALTAVPEGSTSLEMVFDLMNISYPSAQARTIYQRLGLIGRMTQDHATQQSKTAQRPGAQDLLAGTDPDDDEE